MQQLWLEEVKYDIELMERTMARDFRMKAGNVFDFAPIKINEIDKFIRPALVVLMTRLFGGNRAKAITMSAVVQFIHFATVMHNNIKDNEDKFKPQLPVLIGDYLYSKYFSYLAQYDALQYLAPLSEIICEIHTGGVIRKEVLEAGDGSPIEYYQNLKREYGLLMAESCRIAASLSNVSEDIEELAYKFGLNIGIAWGALQEEIFPVLVSESLAKATTLLMQFPEGKTRGILENLIQALDGCSHVSNQGKLASNIS